MRLLIAGLLLLMPIVAVTADDDEGIDVASPYIIEAHVFGQWSTDNQKGDIRYLMYKGGYEEIQTILFIQWISDDDDENPKKIVSSVKIVPAFGNFAPPKILSTNPYVLHIEIDSMYCKEIQKFDIEITGIGKYNLKPLNKKVCDLTDDDTDTNGHQR